MGIGHANDLASIRRISHDLLVASHPGVEDHFSAENSLGAEGAPTKDFSVFKG
jgi:hypothetical protein